MQLALPTTGSWTSIVLSLVRFPRWSLFLLVTHHYNNLVTRWNFFSSQIVLKISSPFYKQVCCHFLPDWSWKKKDQVATVIRTILSSFSEIGHAKSWLPVFIIFNEKKISRTEVVCTHLFFSIKQQRKIIASETSCWKIWQQVFGIWQWIECIENNTNNARNSIKIFSLV